MKVQKKNPDLRRYYREVRGWLPCTRKVKRRIIDKIDSVISIAMEETGKLSYAQIVERFGTPQQIASAYVDEMGTMELLHDLRIKRKIVRIVSVACAMALVMWLGCIAVALIDDYDSGKGYIETILTNAEPTPKE